MKAIYKNYFSIVFFSSLLFACSPSKQIGRSAKHNILQLDALESAHIGISVFDPATGKYLYNYQGDKYFVPASNTKIATCYAAMKYLGDSLVGMRIGLPEEEYLKTAALIIEPTGDPTFLHPSFPQQPVFDYITRKIKEGRHLMIAFHLREPQPWGTGWSWNDYDAGYMAERSQMPLSGNVIYIRLTDSAKRRTPYPTIPGRTGFSLFKTGFPYFDSLVNQHYGFLTDVTRERQRVTVHRHLNDNTFFTTEDSPVFDLQLMPFVTDNVSTAARLLQDSLHKEVTMLVNEKGTERYAAWDTGEYMVSKIKHWKPFYSRPTDSLLMPMMHESDNFFAEQSLMMVSKLLFNRMEEKQVIDTLLQTDFKDLPQQPRWADGSGLSRYNLFTPQDMVAILNKIRTSFGMDRVKTVFATGNEGTLEGYYLEDSSFIYAKTGTLSGVIALSGYLYTKKGKLLIFSVLVNNHRTSSSTVRRAIEAFIKDLRAKE